MNKNIFIEDDKFYVVDKKINRQKSLHTKFSLKENELITNFSANKILLHPTYLTVQIDKEKHIELEPSILQFCNHSCDPNVFFDTEKFEYVALKNIDANEELTFFYPSTEWKMEEPFECLCAKQNCLKTIKGAAYLSQQILANYRLTAFIKKMLATKNEFAK